MDFGLNHEQAILRNEARRFLKNECPMDFVKDMVEDERGYSPILWKKMAELGWMGILFEEKYGGVGGNFLELAIILEEMGRVLLPGPFFSTVILGGGTIARGGNERLKRAFLPKIASGDIILTLAFSETDASYTLGEIELRGERRAKGFVLQGRKMFVPDANNADFIIFPVKALKRNGAEEISLFIVDAKSGGIDISPLISLDLQKQSEVVLNGVCVPDDSLIGEEGEGRVLMQDLWPMVVTSKCSEMLGAMEQVLEMTVSYAQQREQFGRPLSSFQIIQHYCADMAIAMECTKLITYQAVWKVSNGLPSKKEVPMAKAWCSDTLKRMTAMAHQIHGAIGFTKDQNLYLYFRYAKAGEVTFGDADFYKEVVAREMGL
jgi:alkylation response protein AidB-like acyl-CoA dehydrogenase